VTFWYGSRSTKDPTPFFSDLKDAKKNIFLIPYGIFFLLSRRHIIFSLKSFFDEISGSVHLSDKWIRIGPETCGSGSPTLLKMLLFLGDGGEAE
jgi:hypothetical protein